jgi:hypothetical protein
VQGRKSSVGDGLADFRLTSTPVACKPGVDSSVAGARSRNFRMG